MNQEIFETYPVPKAVASLAMPTVLSMLVTIFYNMADTFFVGQTGDPNQVAAVSLATPVFLLLMACGNIFGIGGSSFISRALGEGKKERVKQISSFCFYMGIAVGLIAMIIFLVGMPVILGLIGTSSNTRDYARDYLNYISYGSVFVVLSTAYGNIVRGEGAAKIAMTGMMFGTIVNIVLDPIMIIGMNMGVAGAAIATIIGNICSVIFYIVYIWKGKTLLSISWKDFKMEGIIAKNVFMIGIPASLNNVLMSTSNIILNNVLSVYGDNQVAAMGVAMKANMLVVMVQMGVAMGIQPLVGYNYGAGNMPRLKKVMHFSMLCNVIMGAVLTAVYICFTGQIVQVFINDAEVIRYGIVMLRALMVSGPLIGIMFIFTFSIQAMGKAIPSLILSISRQGLVFFPVLFIANYLIGLNGIVYAQPLADLACLVMAFFMFKVVQKNEVV